jgi:GNAT superfamily N-acetyltransferase/RimJ/RimL family protein N-acetyltransferase
MKLEQFDPAAGEAEVRACYEIYLAGHPIDDPYGPAMSARYFAGWLTLGWTEDPQEVWLARDGQGAPRGWYLLCLPRRENQHLAMLEPTVHPAHRRAGLGTALVRHAAGRAREAGRTVLTGHARDGAPGSAFAAAIGARPGLNQIGRVLRLADLPAGRLAALRAQAEPAARGYALLSWDGPAPDDRVAGLAAINTAAFTDMPRDAGEEPQRWDETRVRLDEQRTAAQGLRWYTVAARSLATGELAAFTQLAVDPAVPSWGFQELTAVARPHRGHRLGLLVKVAMLDLLADREPQLTQIITGNADANEHMIAINAQLGFEVLDQWPSWELDVLRALTERSRTVSLSS